MSEIEFSKKFYDIEKRISEFFEKQDNNRAGLWQWAQRIPILDERFRKLINSSQEMTTYIQNENFEKKSVLDLGCGFCVYWSFLQEYGFSEFVGIDLYSLRGQPAQDLRKTAIKLTNEFCANSSVEIYEDDVRNIDKHITPGRKFDLIFAYSVNYQKCGSTGIPPNIFDNIADKYLASDGIKIYNG